MMKGEEFKFLASLLKRGSGLSLTPDKAKLITGRLKAVADRHGFSTVPALVQALRSGDERLEHSVIEAATTRDTSFFRDAIAFGRFARSDPARPFAGACGQAAPAHLVCRGCYRAGALFACHGHR